MYKELIEKTIDELKFYISQETDDYYSMHIRPQGMTEEQAQMRICGELVELVKRWQDVLNKIDD